MLNLYRVLPYVSGARKGNLGNPLYFPPNQGLARVDNSGHYHVGYLATSASCAVTESFGFLTTWDSHMLRPIKTLPDSQWAVVTYSVSEGDEIFNMDDASNLQKLKLRPSRVVTRDRAITQSWALKIYNDGGSAGVSWWSFYNPDWSCVGLWNLSTLKIKDVDLLTLDHPCVEEASRSTNRPILY